MVSEADCTVECPFHLFRHHLDHFRTVTGFWNDFGGVETNLPGRPGHAIPVFPRRLELHLYGCRDARFSKPVSLVRASLCFHDFWQKYRDLAVGAHPIYHNVCPLSDLQDIRRVVLTHKSLVEDYCGRLKVLALVLEIVEAGAEAKWMVQLLVASLAAVMLRYFPLSPSLLTVEVAQLGWLRVLQEILSLFG